MRWSTRSVLKEDERRFTPWTIYPFERRNSARYAPSCPVAPVMRATLRDDPAITAAHLTLVRIPPQHKRLAWAAKTLKVSSNISLLQLPPRAYDWRRSSNPKKIGCAATAIGTPKSWLRSIGTTISTSMTPHVTILSQGLDAPRTIAELSQ